jgi:DDE superfamily endonuclease
MLSTGLTYVGFSAERQRVRLSLNLDRFKAHYGVLPKALVALYNDFPEVTADTLDIKDFFMAICWLRLYETEHVMAGRWGQGEDTIRGKVRRVSEVIQLLKEKKITWGGFSDDETFIVSVDGVHCRIFEPRNDPGSKWFDHKTNSAGVAYEVALAIRSSRVVHIRGPFPASAHDLTIFRGGTKDDPKDPEALIFKIKQGQKAVSDSAYVGEALADGKASVSRRGELVELQVHKSRSKARQETFNARLKTFNVLEDRFRHGFDRHKTVFEACTVLCQYDMENGNPLFEI